MTDSTHFDFVSNCTTASALYNTLFDQLYDPLPMLLALQKGGVNTVVEDLNIQLGNATFVQDCARQIGTVCRPVVCSSLRFTGNADIAGIGVSLLFQPSLCCILTKRGGHCIWLDRITYNSLHHDPEALQGRCNAIYSFL